MSLDLIYAIVGTLCFYAAYSAFQHYQNKTNPVRRYRTALPNVYTAFWRATGLSPLPEETQLVERVFRAVQAVYGEDDNRLSIDYEIWIVRSPDQRVAWRSRDGILWKDIPEHNGIPALDPARGYGGMEERRMLYAVIWITTFFEDRDPAKLLAHEFAHSISGLGHVPELGDIEAQIVAALDKESKRG